MFRIRLIIALILTIIGVNDCFAQSTSSVSTLRRKNIDQRKSENHPTKEQNSPETNNDNIQWLRVVYRDLDLSKSPNGSLKNNADNRKDLFSILLDLISKDKIKVYEYQDGIERFDEQTEVNAKSLFDRFDINHNNGNIDINDIPSHDVERYYIIEHYFFDSRASKFKRVVKAICPVLERGGITTPEQVRYPMFWVMMDDIRPYISSIMIMTDDNNNVVRHSIDNFFELNMYKGDIYKTQNTTNKSLVQLYPDPNDLANARDSIEKSLVEFEKGLWTPTFNSPVKTNQNKAKNKPVVQKPTEQKTSPTRAGAVRSVRRNHSDS